MDKERAAKDIKLMAKLLNEKTSGETAVCKEEREAFFRVLAGEFRQALGNTTMPGQDALYDEILDIADSMELLRRCTALIGKTIVGVVGLDKNCARRGLEAIVGETAAYQAAVLNVNLPVLFLPGNSSIAATNDVGNQVALDQEEYRRANISLYHAYTPKIDIKQFMESFSLSTETRFPHIAIVYFPRLFASNMPFSQMIMEKMEAVIIYAHDSIIKDSPAGKRVRRFQELGKKNAIPVYIATDAQDDMRGSEIDLEILPENGVFPVLEELNRPCGNAAFVDKIENCLLRARYFCEDRERGLQEARMSVVDDLTRLGHKENETKNAIRDIRDDIQRQEEQAREEWDALRKAMIALMDSAREYEKQLFKTADLDQDVFRPTTETMRAWGEIAMQSVDMGDMRRAVEYIRKLKRAGHRLAYVYELLATDGDHLSSASLRQLREEPDTTDFIRHAKIQLRDALHFDESECAKLASSMEKPQTADEWFFRAKREEGLGNIETAASCYTRALEADAKAIGGKVFSVLQADSKVQEYISMEQLADYMIPEANFALGMQKRGLSDGSKYLKIAAAQHYPPAVSVLTEDLYKTISHDVHSSVEERNEKIDICLNLYQWLTEHAQKDRLPFVCERIGDLYKLREEYARALDWWEKCNTGSAYFKCGKLFEYHTGGVGQDLEKAAQFFRAALECGHADANRELQKVEGWMRDNREKAKQRRQARESYASVYHEETPRVKEPTGCFATSTLAMLNKSDDCYELMKFREFRDGWLRQQPDGAALIDAYYVNAPAIDAAISFMDEAKEIYCSIWNEYLQPCLAFIERKKFLECKTLYQKMLIDLQKRFLGQ